MFDYHEKKNAGIRSAGTEILAIMVAKIMVIVTISITSLWEIGGMGQNSWSKYLLFGKCLRYTVDVDVVFTKKNSSLSTLERGQWIRMLCDSSNLHKQKLVKPKPLASKMGQKNGEVGLLVEYLFCDMIMLDMVLYGIMCISFVSCVFSSFHMCQDMGQRKSASFLLSWKA